MIYPAEILVAVAIPLPGSGGFSEHTPFWAVAMYGIGCIAGLISMFALIRKSRREKARWKQTKGKR
jgi:hypothetical protein